MWWGLFLEVFKVRSAWFWLDLVHGKKMDYLFSEVPSGFCEAVVYLLGLQSCALGVLQEAQQGVWTHSSNHCGVANAARGEFSLFTNSVRMESEEFPMKSSRISCCSRCSRPNRNRIPLMFLWNLKIMCDFSFLCDCCQMSRFIFLNGLVRFFISFEILMHPKSHSLCSAVLAEYFLWSSCLVLIP